MTIALCEVGPRDGLQNEPETLPTATRAELVRRLDATGLARIEAVSFVREDRVPQMANAEAVVAAAGDTKAVLSGLVLNEQGYERLAATPLQEVHVTFAATESFNRRNANRSVEESVAAAGTIVARAHADGRRATVTISTAFGCPFEGEVDPGQVVELALRAAALGADEVVFADTIGVAVPAQVQRLAAASVGTAVGMHFHDTRHTGVANAYAAVAAGITSLDTSVGGLGGCPFAPKATGNVATEDVVYLLEREGLATGVDLEALIAVAAWLETTLGRRLPGRVYRAGGFP